MDAGDYVSKRVDALRHRSQELYELEEGVSNDFDSWSALKLILHSTAVWMYTNVHRSQGTGDIFYIDALAGSGVSTYDSDRCFVGSPIVAARAAQKPFTKMYFIDSNGEYCDALRKRLDYEFKHAECLEPTEYQVIQGNSNEEIDWIIDEIEDIGNYDGRFNYYCFIDNQGLDVNWSTIDKITPSPYGDLLINLPIAHAIGRSANKEALNKFYGRDMKPVTKGGASREELKEIYCNQLATQNREMQESTQVQTNIGSFYYDLLFATRKTGGNNGYMEVIRYAKQFVESVHSGDVDRILEVLDGDQDVINSYLPDDSIDDELPEEDDDDQSDLNEFIQ